MQNLSLRVLLPAAALIFGAAANGWAECADFVSSGINDEPMVGRLISQETRSETKTVTVTVAASIEVVGTGTSGTVTTTTTTTRTYEVGVYDFGGGKRMLLDCTTYTPVKP